MKVHLLTALTILVLSAALIPFATSAPAARKLAASESGTPLGPDDTYFVTQTSLGTPFQVDAGRVALAKGATQAIRTYADLMVSSHITVNDALLAVLKNKAPVPPPTLLKAAYATTVSTLFSMKAARRLTPITFGDRSITRTPTPLSMNMKLPMAQILT
jgi:predicted outer membrane protein